MGIAAFDNLTITLPSPFSPLLKSISSILAAELEEYDAMSLSVSENDEHPNVQGNKQWSLKLLPMVKEIWK